MTKMCEIFSVCGLITRKMKLSGLLSTFQVTYEGEARYPDQPTAGGYGSGPTNGPGQAYVPPQQGGGYKY